MALWIFWFLFALQLPASVQTMRAPGFEITVNLPGWSQNEGPAVLHDHYARLGQFATESGQIVSFLVDDLPAGVTDLESLCHGSQQSYGGKKAGIDLLEATSVGGKPACLFTFPAEAHRRNFYAEMIIEGRWLELHYSAPDDKSAIPTGRQSLDRIISSLESKPAAQSGSLPTADISDAEISFAESRQGCGSKSKDFVCRALAAFNEGKRPSGRPAPVGIAGAAMPIVFGIDVGFETSATYLVVSDTGFRTGGFPNKKDEKAASEVVRAVKAGRHPDENNALVIAARAQTGVKQAGVAERSLVAQPARGFLRETSMGLIYFSLVQPDATGMILGIYPTP